MRILTLLGIVLVAAVGIVVGAAAVQYESVPLRNTNAAHFDTLIVLGTPANPDGKPSPVQRERVLEGVREFRAGRAGHLIMSGGAAHNRFVEAEVMAKLAESEGVPADAVIVEGRSNSTIQNMFYSDEIMRAKGWTSAEIVSSKSHLPRAAMILARYGFAWSTQGSEWPPELSWLDIWGSYAYECIRVVEWKWGGMPKTEFLPVK